MLNPKSRNGAGADIDAGVDSLRAAGLELEVLYSHSPEESNAAIRGRAGQLDLVIVGGGDGTISSTARTLYECGLALAILPLGTANDLARSLGIGDDLRRAFAVIADDHRAPVDLGVVNDCYFFNVANMGLGVQVTEELAPEVKKRWGVFGYLKAFFAALARRREFRVRLVVDGKRRTLRSIQLAVGNGRYYGGGNLVHESARIDDARLDLYCVRPQTAWELLTLAPLLRSGKHDLARRVFNVSGQRIEIATKPKAMSIHADGEPVTRTPASFSVIPGALQVVVPRDTELLSRRGP